MTQIMLGIYDHSGNRIDQVELVRVEPADPEVFHAGFLKGYLADGHTVHGYADWFDRNVPGWRPLFQEEQEAEV